MDPRDEALLNDLRDGRLASDAAAHLRRRLEAEPALREAWAEMARLRDLLRADPGAPPADFVARVREARGRADALPPERDGEAARPHPEEAPSATTRRAPLRLLRGLGVAFAAAAVVVVALTTRVLMDRTEEAPVEGARLPAGTQTDDEGALADRPEEKRSRSAESVTGAAVPAAKDLGTFEAGLSGRAEATLPPVAVPALRPAAEAAAVHVYLLSTESIDAGRREAAVLLAAIRAPEGGARCDQVGEPVPAAGAPEPAPPPAGLVGPATPAPATSPGTPEPPSAPAPAPGSGAPAAPPAGGGPPPPEAQAPAPAGEAAAPEAEGEAPALEDILRRLVPAAGGASSSEDASRAKADSRPRAAAPVVVEADLTAEELGRLAALLRGARPEMRPGAAPPAAPPGSGAAPAGAPEDAKAPAGAAAAGDEGGPPKADPDRGTAVPPETAGAGGSGGGRGGSPSRDGPEGRPPVGGARDETSESAAPRVRVRIVLQAPER